MKTIRNLMEEQNFTQYGFAKLSTPFSINLYKEWLDNEYHGDMNYLKEHLPFKENPKKLSSKINSAIVITQSYFPHPNPLTSSISNLIDNSRVSLYAHGEDYHFWLKKKLNETIKQLEILFPEEEFLSFVDSAPVLERDLAQKAGLGWIGKNTCLINTKKGSLNFIGEIYTSLKFEESLAEINPDRCGNCTKCIDICPTNALIAPKKLDARKCISYLTIESRKVPEESLREQIGDWIFGCDLCQTVCPWNSLTHKPYQFNNNLLSPKNNHQRNTLVKEYKEILVLSNRQLQKKLIGTPLFRAGAKGLKRNTIIAATNLKLAELAPIISEIEHPYFSELKTWSIKQLLAKPKKST